MHSSVLNCIYHIEISEIVSNTYSVKCEKLQNIKFYGGNYI